MHLCVAPIFLVLTASVSVNALPTRYGASVDETSAQAINVLSVSRVEFPWGSSSTKVRGVNLGGWLVLEP